MIIDTCEHEPYELQINDKTDEFLRCQRRSHELMLPFLDNSSLVKLKQERQPGKFITL